MNKTISNFQLPNVLFCKINKIIRFFKKKKTPNKYNMFTYLLPHAMKMIHYQYYYDKYTRNLH